MIEPTPSVIEPIRVLFLAAEADPFVKVGGLGDVGGSLPQALRALLPEENRGNQIDIRLVIPFHGMIDPSAFSLQEIASFTLPYRNSSLQAHVFATEVNHLPVYLISGSPILRDAPVYSPDASLDGRKYTFFSLAALELCRQIHWAPDILHANDWHTALAVYALSLKTRGDAFFDQTKTVLTIHNLPFMGAGAENALTEFHLPPSTNPRLPNWACQFPLPLGLTAADRIIAVSPTYAREILTPEFGCGLQDFLQTRSKSLSGILNGIDTAAWNPATDNNAIVNFDVETIDSRTINKTALQSKFSLVNSPEIPLFAFVGRMDPQKGLDLVTGGLRSISDLAWQAVILGTGNPALEAEARQLENEFPDRVRAVVRFDSRLSHQIYAGADILLMPSRYEPCGLAQMIAMRYGCVPLAHATGGLRDTIIDQESSALGTGFLFEKADVDSMEKALRRAVNLFSNRPAWREIQLRGMQQDFNWKRSAMVYEKLYQEMRKISI